MKKKIAGTLISVVEWLKLWLLVLALSIACAEIAYRTDILSALENIYSDYWHQIAGVRFAPQHVALVAVDDESLAEQADTPLVFWTPHFSRAADVMRCVGVSAVGLDFLTVITPETWLRRTAGLESTSLRDYDLGFRQVLNVGALVIVATHAHDAKSNQDSLLLPHPDYLLSLPELDIPRNVGFANLESDPDGGIRRYAIAPKLNLPADFQEGAPQFNFPALLAQRVVSLGGKQDGLISYAGPPGTVPKVSISRLLAKNACADPLVKSLAGKIVIIGADYQGMGDTHFTPYSRGGGSMFGLPNTLMSGSEIQANIAETLISGRVTAPLGTIERVSLFVVLTLFSVWLFTGLSPKKAFVGLIALSALSLPLGFLAFTHNLILPVAHLQLGFLTAFALCYGHRLSRESREKVRIRQLFSRYVSDDLVDLIVNAKKAPDLGGSYVNITVLFSDIRNFTSISERLDAHEVVEFLNAYFERVCDCVLKHGGSIDKFIGDAIMVEFGSPLPYPDHARRALSAALEIGDIAADFAKWMQQRFPDRGLPPFGIGIGVHSGSAVVGNIGSSRRMEFTAIGDAVNLASRIEGATKEAGCVILASNDSVQAAGPGVITGHTATITVKGRNRPVEVSEIVGIEKQ